MKDTIEIVRCPKCGKLIPAGAAQGLCPSCALAAVAAPTEAGQVSAGRQPPPSLETVASAFPQLEILQFIGAGGMGTVYKARQPRLDRFVALKLLPQGLAGDATFAERFSREARLLARLNHPGIVGVYDYGEANGFFYLLMEFVDGVNLRQAMRAGRFAPIQAMALVPKICEALQFAHDEGILHRDIKPENILLDTRGRLKIADFGIAKLIGDKVKDATLTASGMVVGTPHYMAPEQLEHPQDVDQRADIYSLGVVFYEMLTGELPIGRFAPPSQKTPVDPRVDVVVLQALEKERERRQRNATEVKTEVEQITAAPARSAGGAAITGRPVESGSVESGPRGTVVLPDPNANAQSAPRLASSPAAGNHDNVGYFSTPKRMRNCFHGPQAHIFQCKGELRLEATELVFISPWRMRVVIPLKDIRDLSIGHFQMWTTRWVVKCERVFFLSITSGAAESQRTVHLTPIRAGASTPAVINAQVAEWFEAIRQAVVAITGVSPHVSEPKAVTIHAQRSWLRKAGPLLLFAPLTAWVVGIMNIRSPFGPALLAPWIGAIVLLLLLCLKLGWFAFGFLKANQALKTGDLDAVTSDEPPGDANDLAGDALSAGEHGGTRAKRPFWWTAIAWAFVAVGILSLIDTLTGLYSRPIGQTFYPGIIHFFVGIAMLTLNRRWRLVALVGLTIAIVAGAFISTFFFIAPEHGSVNLPPLNTRIPVTEMPRLAATAVVFLALALGGPWYLLMSARGKSLFGLTQPK